MILGAVFPTCEIGTDPAAIRDFAQAAEDLGYEHLLVYDHVLGAAHEDRHPPLRGPYDEHDEFHEPLVLLGYLAAVTSRIALMTGVLVLPQRQTALVAKQAAEIDLLSSQRLRLGIGTGWNPVEYEALGVPFEARADRFTEQVTVLRMLWEDPLVDYTGRHHRIDRAALVPRPQRRIPLWFGGQTPVALRRSARLGDGHLFARSNAGVRDGALLLAESRPGLPLETILDYNQGPDGWRTEADRWRDVGGTHCAIRTMSTAASAVGATPPGFTSPGQHLGALTDFVKVLTEREGAK